MWWSPFEVASGLLLAAVTVRDVYDTVVVPGGSRTSLHVARRILFVSLPVWRTLGRNKGIPTSFAPFVLVSSFVAWMLLLTMGFGVMVLGLGDEFTPRISNLADALYVAGSALLTVGLDEARAVGFARLVPLAAGFCGLAVMTMAVTYLLQVQTSLAQRDTFIFEVTSATGEPPSGLALLESYAGLDIRDHIPKLLADGRDWCTHIQQSHASHPTLIYFRSRGAGSGWPATLGALLDLALMILILIDEPDCRGRATLLLRDGERAASTLVEQIGLKHDAAPVSNEELDELLSRLQAAGYRLQSPLDRDAFMRRRAPFAGCVGVLAHHLGTSQSPLLKEAPPMEQTHVA